MVEIAERALLDHFDAGMRGWLASLATRKRYVDGEVIHARGDPDPTMCIVAEGRVRMVRLRASGRVSLVSMIGPGHHFADVLMPGNAPRTHHAVAVGQVAIDHYDQQAFARLLDRPEVLRALYLVTASRLNGAMSMLDDLRSLAPEAHLAKVLLHMRRRVRADGTIPCVQEDLAALLGVSGMTLAKALAKLKHEGLIETGYRKIRLTDPAKLRRWLAAREAE